MKLQDDQLCREELIDKLFNIFDNFGGVSENGFTMLLNGKYGSGKSTLLEFIKEKNQQTNTYDIVEYNAWANNFYDNPLIPILYTLSTLKSTRGKIGEKLANTVTKLAKSFTTTLANAHLVDLTAFTEKETTIFSDYKNLKKAIEEFKTSLTNYCKDKKVVLLVDELDRCLPEYQVKVLETLYNILGVQNLIVLIALDKEQLEYSIKNQFGDAKNTSGYLAKFIDYEVDLPDDSEIPFYASLLKFSLPQGNTDKIFIANIIKTAGASIRENLRIINQINLIIPKVWNKPSLPPVFAVFTIIVLFAKHFESRIYKEYFVDYDSVNVKDIPLSKTNYYKFIQEVKNTKIENIIELLINDTNRGHFNLLQIINYFDYTANINLADLANYFQSSAEELKVMVERNYMSNLSYYFNDIVENIKIMM